MSTSARRKRLTAMGTGIRVALLTLALTGCPLIQHRPPMIVPSSLATYSPPPMYQLWADQVVRCAKELKDVIRPYRLGLFGTVLMWIEWCGKRSRRKTRMADFPAELADVLVSPVPVQSIPSLSPASISTGRGSLSMKFCTSLWRRVRKSKRNMAFPGACASSFNLLY